MDIECPNCGFLQPQDEFCPKCGINIYKYNKKKKSSWKKSPFVYLFLFLIFSLLSLKLFFPFLFPSKEEGLFLAKRKNQLTLLSDPQKKPESAFTALTASRTHFKKEGNKAKKPPSVRKKVPTRSEEKKIPPDIKKDSYPMSLNKTKKENPSPSPFSKEKTFKNPKDNPNKKKTSYSLELFFYEMTKESLENLFTRETALNSNTLLLTSEIPLSQYLESLNGKVIGRFSEIPFQNQEILIDLVNSKQKSFLKEETEEEATILNLRILHSVSKQKDPKDLTHQMDISTEHSFEEEIGFEGSFSFSGKNRALLMVGHIPQRGLSEQERISVNSPLQIMNSSSFLNQETDLVLIFRLKELPP